MIRNSQHHNTHASQPITVDEVEINVTPLNCRSLRAQDKWNGVLDYLRATNSHVSILTETWLDHLKINKIQGTIVAQSPPGAHQGVMIIASDMVTNCQPILPDLWTTSIIATVVHVLNHDHSAQTKCYVIAYYGKPDELQAQETLLRAFVRHIHTIDRAPNIILGGDFNRKIDKVGDLSLHLNCWPTQ